MKCLYLCWIFFLANLTSAQILEWSPLFPTVDDTITITYDATLGSAGLVGASDVYAHTGVLTEDSTNPSDWKYVIAGWTQNIPKAKMIPLGNNKWQLRYHIQSYYNFPNTTKVTHLAFVFRNSDGSRTGKTADGGDIFLPVCQKGLNLARLSPLSYHNILTAGDSLKIVCIAANAKKLELFLDGDLLKSSISDTLIHVLVPSTFDKHRLRIEASDASGATKVDSFYYVLRPDAPIAPLPANVRDGINYTAGENITLVLHAPLKKFVYLFGDWNDWEADPLYYLKKTPDEERYWITLADQPPDVTFRYQYWVDGQLKIADPYAELVLDPQHDPFIRSSTFPNLPPYPQDKTTEIVSVLQTSPSHYKWQAINYCRPAKENLIIYELLLRDFLREHDYKTLIDTLGYFEKLGVNAIELLPMSEFEGNSSWGYNPSFYFAPDKYYGPKKDVQRFIDAAHQRGIAVIQDIVLNHTYGQSPMVRLYLDDLSASPWYNVRSPNPVFSWGYDFNHESRDTQQFIDRVTEFWLTEYRIDGFRFDFTKGFTNTPGDGSARDNDRISILKRMADAIWAIDPTVYIILEHFTDNIEEQELAEYGMLIWGNLNDKYNEATMGYHDNSKSDFSRGTYKRRGWDVPHLVTYMESHDEERLMVKNIKYGNSSGTYNIKDEKTALERIELAATFFFTIPGPKMFWQFGELGYDYSIEYNGRVGEKPPRWDYARQTKRQKLRDVFSTLIRLKQHYPTFSSSDFTFSFGPAVKWLKINHDSMNAVIIGNFDVVERSVRITFQRTGTWHDFFKRDSLIIDSTRQNILLLPGEYHIYTDKKTDDSLISHIEKPITPMPATFLLYQNYPNPFNPHTTIKYAIPQDKIVYLKIYNILGEEITTLVHTFQTAGEYAVTFNAEQYSSGIYFYQLRTDLGTFTKRMLLMK
ncbi:DUF4961 domain-containing protein [candidate division KSB1 bacterium]|nr:DUF4961 domain-containing protein [candidate division KSB1 bacterium]RQW01576.1 MAG: DUF4961 domain-containing protein [candidate division KSB1 bacterium]